MTEPTDTATIGTAADCTVRVDDEYASSHHARVTRDQAGQMWIQDLGSTNGTWVNGVRVYARTPLQRGDQIRIGRTEVTR